MASRMAFEVRLDWIRESLLAVISSFNLKDRVADLYWPFKPRPVSALTVLRAVLQDHVASCVPILRLSAT